MNHIIWIYKKSENYHYQPIPKEDWGKLQERPEMIEEINEIIVEGLNQALDFYEWTVKPRGFLIEESKRFGMEAGNIHGMRISFQVIIKPLIEAF